MLKNPYLLALAGGLALALAVAGPLVDDGVAPSEACAIGLAFLGGSGLASAPGVPRKPRA